MSQTPSTTPFTIGNYHCELCLGSGISGVSYLARTQDGAPRTVKRIYQEATRIGPEPNYILLAAQAATCIKHPNIAKTYEVLQAGADHYVVTEYIEGINLSQLLPHSGAGRLPVDSALQIVWQICQGLDCAHHLSRGGRRWPLIHGALWPENVLVAWNGAIILRDFGSPYRPQFARLLRPYIAPEHEFGSLSIATDIYAVGILMYELLTGQPHMDAEGATPRTLSGTVGIPANVHPILERCLSREPSARFAEVADLLDALARAAPGIASSDNRQQLTAVLDEFDRRLETTQVAQRLRGGLGFVDPPSTQAVALEDLESLESTRREDPEFFEDNDTHVSSFDQLVATRRGQDDYGNLDTTDEQSVATEQDLSDLATASDLSGRSKALSNTDRDLLYEVEEATRPGVRLSVDLPHDLEATAIREVPAPIVPMGSNRAAQDSREEPTMTVTIKPRRLPADMGLSTTQDSFPENLQEISSKQVIPLPSDEILDPADGAVSPSSLITSDGATGYTSVTTAATPATKPPRPPDDSVSFQPLRAAMGSSLNELPERGEPSELLATGGDGSVSMLSLPVGLRDKLGEIYRNPNAALITLCMTIIFVFVSGGLLIRSCRQSATTADKLATNDPPISITAGTAEILPSNSAAAAQTRKPDAAVKRPPDIGIDTAPPPADTGPPPAAKPAKTVATLTISSSPQAVVYVDGKRLGKTPQKISEKIGARRYVALVASRYKLSGRRYRFNEDAAVDIELEAAKRPNYGRRSRGVLNILCDRKDRRRILIDGQDTGRSCPAARYLLKPRRRRYRVGFTSLKDGSVRTVRAKIRRRRWTKLDIRKNKKRRYRKRRRYRSKRYRSKRYRSKRRSKRYRSKRRSRARKRRARKRRSKRRKRSSNPYR